ncbi:MAG: hypothetical protein PHO91_01590 [Patescibacteria group bacterium]|nr:hypothetical protein [Patescibacteria group bacterium]
MTSPNEQSPASVGDKDKKILKWIGKAFLVILAIGIWYISIPVILTWYIWKKSKLNKKKKYIGTVLAIVLFVVLLGLYSHLNRTPSLAITEPNEGFAIQASETTIKGTIDPKDAILDINGVVIKTENGTFSYAAKLSDEKNTFTLKVSNSNGQSEQKIIVNRIFTEKELVEYERKKAEEEAEARKKMIEKQFSAWDGSHIQLTKLIKNAMNDPKSYEHVETTYWDMKNHLIVNTTFRGKNAFGGTVKNTIKAKVSIDGENIEILEQY